IRDRNVTGVQTCALPILYATASMEDTRMPGAPVVIVTRALARHLWPNADAIGQRLWLAGSHPYTVVGVIANVVRPGHARGLRDRSGERRVGKAGRSCAPR